MTLDQALAGWRKTRHPRWAAAVELLAKQEPERPIVGAGRKKADTAAWSALAKKADVRDLPRLFAATLTTNAEEATDRLKVLAKLDDPRLTTLILAAFEAPPWRANVFKGFVTQALAIIVKARDVRARDVLADLAPRYKGIIESSVGDFVGTKLALAAKELEPLEPKPLSAADEKKLAGIEAMLPAALVKPKQGKSRNEQELLSLIYASPDDDQPRLVFADALSERGDERGEFISLQIARARGQATPEQLAREEDLALDKKRRTAWALPLANGGDCTLERGFPARIVLKTATAKKIIGDPAWATIRQVAGLETLSAKVGAELVDHPAFSRVRELRTLKPSLAALLEVKPRAWTSLKADFTPTVEQTTSWSALEVLELWGDEEQPKLTAEVLAPLTKLVELGVDDKMLAPDALAALPKLKRLRLGLDGSPPVSGLLKPLTGLEVLEVWAASRLPLGDLFSSTSKTVRTLVLGANFLKQDQVAAGLAALPNVEKLELSSPEWATLEVIQKLITKTKVRAVVVRSDFGEYELKGTTLTIENVRSGRTAEQLLGARVPKGMLTTVRFPDPFDDDDRAKIETWATAQGLGLTA